MAELDAALIQSAYAPAGSQILLSTGTYDGEGVARVAPPNIIVRGKWGHRPEWQHLPFEIGAGGTLRQIYTANDNGVRWSDSGGSSVAPGGLPDSITINQAGAKLISCVLYDQQTSCIYNQGVGATQIEMVLAGLQGHNAPDRGHHHGKYSHNHSDSGAEKVSHGLILLPGWGNASQDYSASGNHTRDFKYRECVFARGRVINGTGDATGNEFSDSWFFEPARIDFGYTADSGDLLLSDNHFVGRAGSAKPIYIDRYAVSGSGNKFYKIWGYRDAVAELLSGLTANDWIAAQVSFDIDGSTYTDFGSVQVLGVEVDSSFTVGSPTATETQVIANAEKDSDDPFCGFVVIYNPSGASTVNVDLTALGLGSHQTLAGHSGDATIYEARYYQNFWDADNRFEFDSADGATVTFPMTGWTAKEQSYVSGSPCDHPVTAPTFAVFVITEKGGFGDGV